MPKNNRYIVGETLSKTTYYEVFAENVESAFAQVREGKASEYKDMIQYFGDMPEREIIDMYPGSKRHANDMRKKT